MPVPRSSFVVTPDSGVRSLGAVEDVTPYAERRADAIARRCGAS